MTTAEAIALANAEIITILNGAGLVQGETLMPSAITTSTVPLYWDVMAKGKLASEQETYLTWNIISVDPIGRSDNKIKMRLAFVSIDIFTRKVRSAKDIADLISEIEEKALGKGWSFELSMASGYETDLKTTHIAFDLTKKFTN